jgi:hypothetical protein
MRQAPVQRLRYEVGLTAVSKSVLDCLLPPNESLDTLVPLLSEHERRPEEIGKVVFEPVLHPQDAGRGKRGHVDTSLPHVASHGANMLVRHRYPHGCNLGGGTDIRGDVTGSCA